MTKTACPAREKTREVVCLLLGLSKAPSNLHRMQLVCGGVVYVRIHRLNKG